MSSQLYSTTQENELKKQERRAEIFKESKFDPSKQKFGLFSFTGTLAISRRGYESQRLSRRDADGAVITAPRNCLGSVTKKGKGPEVYFSEPRFISIGDPYQDPAKPQRLEKERSDKSKKVHEVAFKSPGPVQLTSVPEFIPEGEQPRRVKRDNDGGVLFGPRNFYTSPPKLGNPSNTPGTALGKVPEYIGESYKSQKLKVEDNRTDLHDRPFKAMCNSGGTFFDTKTTYGKEGISYKSQTAQQNKLNIYPHERAFLPASSTKSHKEDSSFAPFPTYSSNPISETHRREPDTRVPFKVAGNGNTSPTPSIASKISNLKAEYPRIRM